jgi:hypothetical protein
MTAHYGKSQKTYLIHQIPPITGPNRSMAISDKEKANLFGSNIFKPHTDIYPSTEHLERINSFINSPLPMSISAKHTSPNEIKFLISKLKEKKSTRL